MSQEPKNGKIKINASAIAVILALLLNALITFGTVTFSSGIITEKVNNLQRQYDVRTTLIDKMSSKLDTLIERITRLEAKTGG